MGPRAVALFALLASSLISSAYTAAAKFAVGGATSFLQIGPALLTGPCKSVAKGQVYQSVGSGAGIANFNDGTYVVSLSDSPMKPEEENLAGSVSKKYGKLTIPLILARYSFFINGLADGVAKLDAAATYKMYKSAGKAWSTVGVPSLKTTKVVPIAREDSSGTTFVIKRYWKVGGTTFLADFGNDNYNSKKMTIPGLKFADGNGGVCKLAETTKGGVCYAQVGVCNTIVGNGKIGEVSLKNKAGNYVLSSSADASQAIPRILPARTASYNAIGESTILAKGGQTPAIVSFLYGFIRAKGLKDAGTFGTTGKNILTCINSKVNSLATKYQFDNTPQKLINVNADAIKKVK